MPRTTNPNEQRPRQTDDRERSSASGRQYAARRRRSGLGFARKRDVDDSASQSAAPRGPAGRYDRTGEKQYEEGLEQFEEQRQPSATTGRGSWELDEGGVQFGAPAQSFAGRGPRGYRRSDARIREDVCDVLTEAADVDASDIDVTVSDGVVTLGGSIADQPARTRTETLVAMIAGVSGVQNRITVRKQRDTSSAGEWP
jgi:osmotically-inducible protein OsmY